MHMDTVTEKQLLDDLCRVSAMLKKSTVTVLEYEKHGAFSRYRYARQFGSWLKALDRAGLDIKRGRSSPINKDDMVNDLKRVSADLNKQSVTMAEYQHSGRFSISLFYKAFRSWRKALKQAGLKESKRKGVIKIKDIILEKYPPDVLHSALQLLYPENIKTLRDHREYVLFKKHVLGGDNLADVAAQSDLSESLAKKNNHPCVLQDTDSF